MLRCSNKFEQRHTKYGRIRGMVVGEGGRSTGVILYNNYIRKSYNCDEVNYQKYGLLFTRMINDNATYSD